MLLALLDLASNRGSGYVLSRDVAQRQGIPVKYMPQLMAILSREGWVQSIRGAKGGVRLAVDPGEVTVQDVIRLSGDPLLVKDCVASPGTCSKEAVCPLHPVWSRAQASLDEAIRGTTLANLLTRKD